MGTLYLCLYLQDRSERCDADSRANEDSVLRSEDVGGGGAKGSVDVDFERLLKDDSFSGPASESFMIN